MANKTDTVLQYINKNFITLQDEDKKHYMRHYQSVIEELVRLMKQKDELFKAIFQNFFWAGSYYDGLKVGKPEEYDVDVVMNLPINYEQVQIINNNVKPPFTKIKMEAMDQLKHHPKWTDVYRHMDSWTDRDGFLLQSKFRTWMESAVNRALNEMPKEGNMAKLTVNGFSYLILLKKTGPAMTLNITIPGGTKLDVDFVPVFEFKHPKWPPAPVRPNMHSEKKSWFIVPKPNSKITSEFVDTYWRLAFHDQEREMISNKGQLKPVCRLLKKLRDTQGLKAICSYYIKTMFLWEITRRDASYWKSSLSVQFMDMLKLLRDEIKKGRINYFWDDRYNLLSGMGDVARGNVEGRLNKIIGDIERKSPEDPTIVAHYLLTKEEYSQLQAAMPRVPSPSASCTEETPTTSPAEPASGVQTLATVFGMLLTIRQELADQKKLTQTVLDKVSVLQLAVDSLTSENTVLHEELALTRMVTSKLETSCTATMH